MKKIKSSIILFSIFTSLLIAGCSNSSNQSSGSAKANGKESNTIRMAIDTAAGGSLQFRQAEKRLFKQQNVDAKLSNFAMGVDTINAVLTEQADTGIAADYVAINSLAKGDLVVVATLTRGNEKTQKANQLLATGNIKARLT